MDKYINPAYIARLVIEGLGEEQGRISRERLSDGMSVISFTNGVDMLEMAIGKKSETCVVSKVSAAGVEFTKALASRLSNKDVADVFIEEVRGWSHRE